MDPWLDKVISCLMGGWVGAFHHPAKTVRPLSHHSAMMGALAKSCCSLPAEDDDTLVSRTARSFPEPITRKTLSVSAPGTTPGEASTYPAKTVRPLRVARWPQGNKNQPSYIPYSTKILQLISTNLAAIAALCTSLTVSQSQVTNAGTRRLLVSQPPGPLCRLMVPTSPW